MASSLRLDSGYVSPFRGSVGENFSTFWEKFQVLAKTQKWDSGEKRATHLPLFLAGDAFLVYSRLSDAQKKDENEIKSKLVAAFSVSKSQAYKLFTSRRLRHDESVEAYAASLQHLAVQTGHSKDSDEDPMVVEQFLAGLPEEFSRQVRLSYAGQETTLSGCVERVRALRVSEKDHRSSSSRQGVAARGVGTKF